jgi:hypothetical protein
MAYDHIISLTGKDGARRLFHIYGRPTPKRGDVVTLPVDGRPIKARILRSANGSEGPAHEAVALETLEA